MVEDLNCVSDYLRLYRTKEQLYLCDGAKSIDTNLLHAVERFYSYIFEYQARLICHLSKGSLKRGLRGTLKLDDWKGMLKLIKDSDGACSRYFALFDQEKAREHHESDTNQMLSSLSIQEKIYKMLGFYREDQQQGRQADQEATILEILASDYISDKDTISRKVPGTCEWFYKDNRFLDWCDSNTSRLLWVSAGPGCGKSVLSRSLIDERRVCDSSLTSTVCYFFFKDGQETRTHASDAISAMLHQLFSNTALVSHAIPSHKKYGKKLRDTFSELWDILINCARDSEAGEIVCVIDALDECEQNARSQLITKLVDFYTEVEEENVSSFSLKFLVTSRPYDSVEERFRSLSNIGSYLRFDGDDKSDEIGQEIYLVIDAKIAIIAADFSDENQKRISERLKLMDSRTYLWLFLTFDIVSASRSRYSKISKIEALLADLPSQVSDAYEKILSRSSDKATARILLQIVVAARRPLTVEEVNIALTLAT